MNIKDVDIGDTVLARLTVTSVDIADNTIEFVDVTDGGHLRINGSQIEEVRKSPFDWDTIKPGDCFKNLTGELRYYIAEDPRPKAGFDLVMYDFEGIILGADRDVLTRFPKGDKNAE